MPWFYTADHGHEPRTWAHRAHRRTRAGGVPGTGETRAGFGTLGADRFRDVAVDRSRERGNLGRLFLIEPRMNARGRRARGAKPHPRQRHGSPRPCRELCFGAK